MQYRLLSHLIIETRSREEAVAVAKKLHELLKSPMVRMAIQSEGIRLANGDGRPVVYDPQPEPPPRPPEPAY